MRVLNSARQIGGVLGVAVFGFLVRSGQPTLFMDGMHISIAVAGVLLAIGAILSFFGIQPPESSDSKELDETAAAFAIKHRSSSIIQRAATVKEVANLPATQRR